MNYQITKNQHYVPQCLLKHFSNQSKNKKTLNIFDAVRASVRYNQPITKVFSQNYFYDKDNSVETILTNKVESPASPIIDKIIKEDLSIIDSPENWIHLLKFISTLIHRTTEAEEKLLSFIQTGFKSFAKELLRLNNFPSDVSVPSFEFENTDGFVSLTTLQAYYGSILLTDLDLHIVKNETELDFIISDHPAFAYNWFYRDLKHPGITSPMAMGYQIFLPLSPKISLCLYDPKVYTYGSKSKITPNKNLKDIEILNKFQIINSQSIIGFKSKQTEDHIKKLYQRFGSIKIHTHKSNEYEVERKDDEIRTRHITYTEQTKLNQMPSFVRIKKQAKKNSKLYYERNPELTNAFHQLINNKNQNSIIPI